MCKTKINSDIIMPALFVGHGSPMNALEENEFTQAWQKVAQNLPKPKAILVISAHWYIDSTAVTVMEKPKTIHDFYGFPKSLFDMGYPAPGLPKLFDEIVDLVQPLPVVADVENWGIDHGAWSVLKHLFPKADVPVVQLSINALKPLEYHVELGRKLNKLREKGILILASGNVVHNLRKINWNAKTQGEIWAKRFDKAVLNQMLDKPSEILKVTGHPDYELSVPTPDHFIPLLYLAGLASASNEQVNVLIEGYALGSLSMTCYGLGFEGFKTISV
ncbi:MAG: 4,5-DOPA dioxygenase extradiol [Proteobacteria bacterium]|nr:MAG: 4,5-DOPA dioxygenase extradiol [Pseudomonadota bacterium]